MTGPAGITSLDGYINDAHGRFDWAAPSDQVHAFVNELERGVGTYLYGRRLYDTMTFGETPSPAMAYRSCRTATPTGSNCSTSGASMTGASMCATRSAESAGGRARGGIGSHHA